MLPKIGLLDRFAMTSRERERERERERGREHLSDDELTQYILFLYEWCMKLFICLLLIIILLPFPKTIVALLYSMMFQFEYKHRLSNWSLPIWNELIITGKYIDLTFHHSFSYLFSLFESSKRIALEIFLFFY